MVWIEAMVADLDELILRGENTIRIVVEKEIQSMTQVERNWIAITICAIVT